MQGPSLTPPGHLPEKVFQRTRGPLFQPGMQGTPCLQAEPPAPAAPHPAGRPSALGSWKPSKAALALGGQRGGGAAISSRDTCRTVLPSSMPQTSPALLIRVSSSASHSWSPLPFADISPLMNYSISGLGSAVSGRPEPHRRDPCMCPSQGCVHRGCQGTALCLPRIGSSWAPLHH